MSKLFVDHSDLESFLQSESSQDIQVMMTQLNNELMKEFDFFVELVLLGSFRSGNWAIRTMRKSSDTSDIDTVALVSFSPNYDEEKKIQDIYKLDLFIENFLKTRKLLPCHLIRATRCCLNISNLRSHFETLREEAEEFLYTEGSFEIDKIATIAGGLASATHRKNVILELEEYFRNDPQGLSLIKSALNSFLDVMHTVRYKHMAEKGDKQDSETLRLCNRMAQKINSLKQKSGKRGVSNI